MCEHKEDEDIKVEDILLKIESYKYYRFKFHSLQ